MRLLFKLFPVALLSIVLPKAHAQRRRDLLTALVNQKVTVAEIKEITLRPNQAAPKHLHPCPVIGYVVKGRVLFQLERGERVILEEGDTFLEPKGQVVVHFDNLGQAPATFIAIYLKEGNEESVKLLD